MARWWCRTAARICAVPAPRTFCNGPRRNGRSNGRRERVSLHLRHALATTTAVILRCSPPLAASLEGWPQALVAHPSRLGLKKAEHLRMTEVLVAGPSCSHNDGGSN